MNKKLLTKLIKLWKEQASKHLSEGAQKDMRSEIDVALLTLKFNQGCNLPGVQKECKELLADRLIEQVINVTKETLGELYRVGLMNDVTEHYPDEYDLCEAVFDTLRSDEKMITKYVPGFKGLLNGWDDYVSMIEDIDLNRYAESI